ncbi:hypothetical protein BCF59_0437 [Mycoplasmopsis mustelae]|uniref:DUF3137 domain-containing protein n=1 Tax=Mycoplasmopsis mustelae TaxID=171289 RepID=A0A4R7UFS6_9BACT|nr:hypothetical protein [Mycoplasmopsis mustelae]TDV24465.1 hypothetical protein BCF59_0437 [Mycoplasmopsis mustelae]
MRIVEDYTKYTDYEVKAREKLLPRVKEAVDKILTPENKKKYLSVLKTTKIVFGASIISLFLAIILIIAFSRGNGGATFVIGIIFLAITAILTIITILYYLKTMKEKRALKSMIVNLLDQDTLYKEAYDLLDDSMDYISKERCDEIGHLYFKNCEIKRSEMHKYRCTVPPEASIHKITQPRYVLIDKKYPASLQNIMWREVIRRNKNYDEEKFYYTGLMKIDTRALGDKAMRFTLLNGMLSNKIGKFFRKIVGLDDGLKLINLENKEFVKIFQFRAQNEIKARMMYTPLSMEISLKRFFDRTGVKIRGLSVISDGASIYFEYEVDFGFMFLDLPFSIKSKERVIQSIYKDLLLDTYSLYYMLSLMYIPIYLQ